MNVNDSALAVVRALERMGVRYYIAGSLASSLHGVPRATNDVDIVALLGAMHFERLQKELGTRFYVDPEEFESATQRRKSFNLIDEIELAKVDVFCVEDEGFQASALERVVKLELAPEDPFSKVNVSSAEDTLLAKLRWYQMGGKVSDRQWADVEGIIQAQQTSLDLRYLREWSSRLGVADLLERLLSGQANRTS